jgi:hypothetical protein
MKMGVWATALNRSLQVVYVQSRTTTFCHFMLQYGYMRHLHPNFPLPYKQPFRNGPTLTKNFTLKLWRKPQGEKKKTLYMSMPTLKNIKFTAKRWQQIPTIAVRIKTTPIIIRMARSGRQNYAVGFRTLGTYKNHISTLDTLSYETQNEWVWCDNNLPHNTISDQYLSECRSLLPSLIH